MIERISTTISPEYCPHWGVLEALRELIQEMLDVKEIYGCRSAYRYISPYFYMVDDGPGLQISDLAFGISRGKRDNINTIGQHGEGLKMACLVFAREKRNMEINTVGFSLRPMIDQNELLRCDTLCFLVWPNQKIQGTEIKVEVSQEELNEALKLFLHFTKNTYRKADGDPITEKDSIFLPGGEVFVQGVKIKFEPRHDTSFLFSYNIQNKELINRDRWSVDVEQTLKEIRNIWFWTQDKGAIEELIKNIVRCGISFPMINNIAEVVLNTLPGTNCLENEQFPISLWQEVVQKHIIDAKVILNDGVSPSTETRLQSMGYKLLEGLPFSFRHFLSYLGVEEASKVNKKLGNYREVQLNKLSPSQRQNLRKAKRLVRTKLGFMLKDENITDFSLHPVKFFDENMLGLCQWNKYRSSETHEDIFISVDILDDLERTISTVVHELAHLISRSNDYTNSFQDTLSQITAKLLLMKGR